MNDLGFCQKELWSKMSFEYSFTELVVQLVQQYQESEKAFSDIQTSDDIEGKELKGILENIFQMARLGFMTVRLPSHHLVHSKNHETLRKMGFYVMYEDYGYYCISWKHHLEELELK